MCHLSTLHSLSQPLTRRPSVHLLLSWEESLWWTMAWRIKYFSIAQGKESGLLAYGSPAPTCPSPFRVYGDDKLALIPSKCRHLCNYLSDQVLVNMCRVEVVCDETLILPSLPISWWSISCAVVMDTEFVICSSLHSTPLSTRAVKLFR